MPNEIATTRLDKWLWAARFFKTRSIATDAINGGKVHLNGERVKPSHKLCVGDQLSVRQGTMEKTIVVMAISERRGPATQAAQLYSETEESITRREAEREQRRLLNEANPKYEKRPNKKQRRQIHRFKNIFDKH